jgi:hypothetical protein
MQFYDWFVAMLFLAQIPPRIYKAISPWLYLGTCNFIGDGGFIWHGGYGCKTLVDHSSCHTFSTLRIYEASHADDDGVVFSKTTLPP